MRFVAVFIDAIGCIIAATGVYGTLNLSWQVLVLSLTFQFVLALGFLAFILLNYAGAVRANDQFAYVVLALYLPDVGFKFVLTLAGIPFARSYYRLAMSEQGVEAGSDGASTTAPTTVGVKQIAPMAGSAA